MNEEGVEKGVNHESTLSRSGRTRLREATSKMDKEESAGEGLFSLKPVGCLYFQWILETPRLMQNRFDRTPIEKKVNVGHWRGGGKCNGPARVCCVPAKT